MEATISLFLPASSWKDATLGMKQVMDNLDKIPDQSLRDVIALINTNVFQRTNKTINDASLELKLQSVTTNEFEDMMNEIGDSQAHKSTTVQCQFTPKLKKNLENAFWKPNRTFYDAYICNNIRNKDETQKKKYQTVLKDYLSIHENLIQTKMKQTFLKLIELNGDPNPNVVVKHLFSKLRQYRNICGLFPIKPFVRDYSYTKLRSRSASKFAYLKLIEYFDEQKCSTLKTFMIIYNGICNLFLTLPPGVVDFYHPKYTKLVKQEIGFDGYCFDKLKKLKKKGKGKKKEKEKENTKEKEKEKPKANEKETKPEKVEEKGKNQQESKEEPKSTENSGNENEDENKESKDMLADLCLNWIIDRIVQTGIFQTDKNQSRQETEKKIKETLFNNNLKELKELIDYCIQDISDAVSHVNARKEEPKYQTGIVFYIINRFTFAMFNTLQLDKLRKNKTNDNKIDETGDDFGGLVRFFQFLYNFSVYCHCLSVGNGDKVKSDELFYIKQFFMLKDAIYPLKPVSTLNSFNYFASKEGAHDGTAIFMCLKHDLVTYAGLLLKYGYDASMIDVEKQCKSDSMKVLIKDWQQFNKSQVSQQTDEKEDMKAREDDELSMRMDVKSLESRYDPFTNQLMSSIYLLIAMGCDMERYSKQYGIIDSYTKYFESQVKNNVNKAQVPLKQYDLFCKYRDFGFCVLDKHKEIKNVMPKLVLAVQAILQTKMAISDDLLILSWLFLLCQNDHDDRSKDENTKNDPRKVFLSLIEKTTEDCLQSKKDESSRRYKQRNYHWFKKYLLHSNIWLMKSGKKSNSILFDECLNTVNRELVHQKKYIWKHSQLLQKEENKDKFTKLITFGDSFETKIEKLRQDKISNGIVSDSQELDLLVKSFKMKNSTKSQSNHTYDIMFENNTKAYLTKCLSFAHANNSRLQQEMAKVFSEVIKIDCKYQAAPVKLYNRCVRKCTSDYNDRAFPSGACILDFLRFSATFNNVSSLLDGLEQFIWAINQDKIECLKPNGVLRIKNGFKDIKSKWKSVQDAQYCDIKLNIIYRDSEDNEMIVEAQFLLKFLLQAKKMGHKLYAVVRQSDFIDNIKYEVYSVDNDYVKYRNKINKLIETSDTNNLMKQLFWKPNVIFSILNDNTKMSSNVSVYDTGKYNRSPLTCIAPILYTVFYKFSNLVFLDKGRESKLNHKFSMVFSNFLLHYGSIILDEKYKDSRMKFLYKYFNFLDGRGITLHGGFFGIDYAYIINPIVTNITVPSIVYEMIDIIMKDHLFNGYNQRQTEKYGDPYLILPYLSDCFGRGQFDFVKILYQSFYKNSKMFQRNISSGDVAKMYFKKILKVMIDNGPLKIDEIAIRKEGLQLYLDIVDECEHTIDATALNNGISLLQGCDDRFVTEIRSVIDNYSAKHGIVATSKNEKK